MLALYLLAGHMLGDFVLADRWVSAEKLEDAVVRARHVALYCLPFVPLVVAVEPHSVWRPLAFLACLYVLHFLTDSRRFRATLGDWWRWRSMTGAERADELADERLRHLSAGEYHSAPTLLRIRPSNETARRLPVPPNPWPPIPILIDQTLHLCQLAVLGGVLLR